MAVLAVDIVEHPSCCVMAMALMSDVVRVAERASTISIVMCLA